jgi:hypothetical protein
VLRTRDVFPGSGFIRSRIQGQKGTGTRIWIPNNELKHFSIFLAQIIVTKISEIKTGMLTPDPDFFSHPGSRGQKSTGSRIRTGDKRYREKKAEKRGGRGEGGSIQCTQ